jgi:hypothetical protein
MALLCLLPLTFLRYLWPGSIHAVFTPESTICFGNHFYAISTLSDFVGSSVLTNTQHTKDSRMLLRRILTYIHAETVEAGFVATPNQPHPALEHIPAFDTFEGVVDFFNLLNVIELADALHPQTYSLGGLCIKERAGMIHAQRLARQLQRWFWCNYDISAIPSVPPEHFDQFYWLIRDEFYFKGLAYQAMAILQYKTAAAKAGMCSDVKECTALAVERVIKEVFAHNGVFWQAWNTIHTPELSMESLCWTSWTEDGFTVSVKQPAMPYPSGRFGMYSF